MGNARRFASVLAGLTSAVVFHSCGGPVADHQMEATTSGYTLVAPIGSQGAYLVDGNGRIVHSWQTDGLPGHAAYLLEDGHLLRTGSVGMNGNGVFSGGGAGGVVEEYDWNGTRTWRFEYASEDHLLHHDIKRLPNGNVLMIAWERKSREEAVAVGRDAGLVGDQGMWPDHVIEVKPTRPEGGNVVWEWHVWDHLIQDVDPSKPNYGRIADHPERINVNPPNWVDELSENQREQLEALGYLGGPAQPGRRDLHPDWNHTNAVAYNAELDQIALSVLGLNEIWILDHSTTSKEAAGSTGGRYGKGGDLLYRWGNPSACGQNAESQTLFAQHDVHWIPPGLPGEGHVLVFNNGRGRPGGDYSSVDELALPLTAAGEYERATNGFASARMVWSYEAPDRTSFFSPNISGAQRLPDGNTLICSGAQGRFFEVTPNGNVVWEYELTHADGMPGPLPAGMLHNLFDTLDTNKDGELSRKEFSKLPAPGGPRPGPNGPPGDGPPPRVPQPPPGRAGGAPGPPPPMGNGGPQGLQVFRILRYPFDYPAFAGQNLDPGDDLNATLGGTGRT